MSDLSDEIGSFEAKTRLAELLRETEKGRSFVIMRRGKAVAKLVPIGDEVVETSFDEIRSEFLRIRETVKPGPGIRELIDAGRRF